MHTLYIKTVFSSNILQLVSAYASHIPLIHYSLTISDMSIHCLLRIPLSQNRAGWEICACKYHFHTLLFDLHMQIWVHYIRQEFSQSKSLAYLKLLNPCAYGNFFNCCCGFILFCLLFWSIMTPYTRICCFLDEFLLPLRWCSDEKLL